MTLTAADGALLDAVRALRWPSRTRAPAGLAGEHVSRVLGPSAEFTEYRAYRQGDDPARLDWKLLARSDRAYVRLSNERTVLPTTLVVDASASLAYPAATLEKWHYARQVTLGLAAAAHQGGDPVGLFVATNGGPRRVPLRTRRGVVHEIASMLSNVTPAGSPPLAPVVGLVRAPGRVVIVSDFLGDSDATLKVAGSLAAAGWELYAVHVVHAAELDPPGYQLLVTDPEHHDLRRALTGETRREYLARFALWCSELAREWRGAGAVYTRVATAESAAHAVRRVVSPGAARGAR